MRDDAFRKEVPKEKKSLRKVHKINKVNIGIVDDPKFINLTVTCSEEETLQYIEIFR